MTNLNEMTRKNLENRNKQQQIIELNNKCDKVQRHINRISLDIHRLTHLFINENSSSQNYMRLTSRLKRLQEAKKELSDIQVRINY